MGAQKDENGSSLRSLRYEESVNVADEPLMNYRLAGDFTANESGSSEKCLSSNLLGSLVWSDPLLRPPPLGAMGPNSNRPRPAASTTCTTGQPFFGQYPQFSPQQFDSNAPPQSPLKLSVKSSSPSSCVPPASKSSTGSSALNHRQKFWKTRLCPYHFKKGSVCKGGDKCSYAHSFAELRPSIDLTKTKLCTDYMTHGCLRPPNECPFAHGYDDLRSNAQRLGLEDEDKLQRAAAAAHHHHLILRHAKEAFSRATSSKVQTSIQQQHQAHAHPQHQHARSSQQQYGQAGLLPKEAKRNVRGLGSNLGATNRFTQSSVEVANYLEQLEGDKNVDLNCIQALLSSLLEYSLPSSPSDEDGSATREESGAGQREDSVGESSEALGAGASSCDASDPSRPNSVESLSQEDEQLLTATHSQAIGENKKLCRNEPTNTTGIISSTPNSRTCSTSSSQAGGEVSLGSNSAIASGPQTMDTTLSSTTSLRGSGCGSGV